MAGEAAAASDATAAALSKTVERRRIKEDATMAAVVPEVRREVLTALARQGQ